MQPKLLGSALATASGRLARRTDDRLRGLSIREMPRSTARREVHRAREDVDAALWRDLRGCIEGRNPWPALLAGPTGCGKTCAALALADEVRGPVRYDRMPDLCDALIECQQGTALDEWSGPERRCTPALFWANYRRYMLCIIDEIGVADPVSNHHYLTLLAALEARHGAGLVLVTNQRRDGIVRLYDERLVSRAYSGTVLLLDGPDRRYIHDHDDDRRTNTTETKSIPF